MATSVRKTSYKASASRRAAANQSGRRNLPLLLQQVRERLVTRFRPILNAYGVTEQQYRVLRAIEAGGPLQSWEIGAICHISSPSLAGVLARMEALGWVARERMDHDQRRLLVKLTSNGRSLFRRIWPRIGAVYQALDAALGSELSSELEHALDRVMARLLAADAQDHSTGTNHTRDLVD